MPTEIDPKAYAVKFMKGSREKIEGLLMPFGGPIEGKDLDGEFFSDKTDFALDWYDQRPLLYGHGKDTELETVPVGRITHLEIKDAGGWMRAQLDKSSEYWKYIAELIDEGKLFLSSGAMSHLVKKDTKTGEILRWPVVEGSLTVSPANPLAAIGYKDAERHFEQAGLKPAWESAPVEAPAPDPAEAIEAIERDKRWAGQPFGAQINGTLTQIETALDAVDGCVSRGRQIVMLRQGEAEKAGKPLGRLSRERLRVVLDALDAIDPIREDLRAFISESEPQPSPEQIEKELAAKVAHKRRLLADYHQMKLRHQAATIGATP